MTPSRYLPAVLAAAAIVAVATPSSAFAAGRPTAHQSSSGHAAATPARHKPVDRLSGPRKAALHALATDTAAVTRVAAAEQASVLLGDSDKATAASFTDSALAALTADGAQVATATNVSALNAIQQAGRRTADATGLLGQVLVRAATDGQNLADLSNTAAALETQVASLSPGIDTSAVQTWLSDATSQLTAVQEGLDTVTAAVQSLPAAPSATTLRQAHASTGSAFDAAETALQTASTDLQSAQAALAALITTP